MSWFITNLIAAALLPPLNLLLLLIVGLVVLKRRPKLGRGLLASGIALLWLSATPYFADGAMHWLEKDLKPVGNISADAIVILGSGSYFHPPEYAQDTVSKDTLARVRYGAMLHRKTGKPILVTGGAPLGNAGSEGQQMKAVLEHEFQVPVRWTEDLSDNTLENAQFSAKILQAAGIKRIYLVSHAWHLPRSIMVFRQAGFEVIPAPTAYTTRYETNLLTFLPNTDALHNSKILTHEIIGLIWYQLKSWAN
jgi:uncharacterized SAM-binding protein YcdF (DUF218 family)